MTPSQPNSAARRASDGDNTPFTTSAPVQLDLSHSKSFQPIERSIWLLTYSMTPVRPRLTDGAYRVTFARSNGLPKSFGKTQRGWAANWSRERKVNRGGNVMPVAMSRSRFPASGVSTVKQIATYP